MTSKSPLMLALAGLVALSGFSAEAQAATKYGCFKVTVPSLNLRARPYSTADVIGVAHKGDILEKRKLFCTPRGFWCAVRKGSLEGYADKSNMAKIACP
ncbi:MAG: SH3 domain-containing protein [Hyphomicrobium zavarzinii]|uniref:SH3 domain-containing protein n=1 Tax=Hyphomicrobium TaxID=81 RepID=UPI00035DEB12|nr:MULTISPECIES: SH3 domain-containing protein [Hyphomicrobium]MBL8845372.1 SH3 domain-containing protein [Hyphomicrobium zavarzinii]WBT40236.1 SH3 domain-containing protein [Hyphomicrobium sp. DMF-1]HML44630.1 SH3 domain-containing protein [Hyphomicrobium zavarzinii]